MCLVGVALLVLLGCCLVCFLLLFDSAWWNRGIAEEVTMASYGKAVTGTAVMARSANEEKKKGTIMFIAFHWFSLTGDIWMTMPQVALAYNGFLKHRNSLTASPPQDYWYLPTPAAVSAQIPLSNGERCEST